MTLGLTDTSPGPAEEVTRDTTWPRRCHGHVSRVTCHGPREARLGHSSGRGICIRCGLVLALVVTRPRYHHHHQCAAVLQCCSVSCVAADR